MVEPNYVKRFPYTLPQPMLNQRITDLMSSYLDKKISASGAEIILRGWGIHKDYAFRLVTHWWMQLPSEEYPNAYEG